MKKLVLTVFISILFIKPIYAVNEETDLTELKNNIKNLEDKLNQLENQRLDSIYPIGSIYETTTYSTVQDVNNVLGGQWEKYGKGKTLVGVDENDIDFNKAGIDNKGSKTTLLTIQNLPSHNHSIPKLTGTADSTGSAHTHTLYGGILAYVSNGTGNGSINSGNAYGSLDWLKMSGIYSSGAHTHSVTTNANTTGSSGGNTAFTNLQPYITVYMYKRIG